jgi:hypothetical protein
LGSHSDIVVAQPERPEPKFFLSSSDHSEYHRKHFVGDAHLFLEKSTTYLERPDAEARMREIPGGVWPIAILRDPVDRALSNWRFSTENGLETLPVDQALTEGEEGRPFPSHLSTSPYHYLKRSRYESLVAPWLEVRGRDGMSFVLYEELIASPVDVLAKLHEDLGLRFEAPTALPHVNSTKQTGELEDDTLKRLCDMFGPEAEAVADLVPAAARLWPTLASKA